MTIFNALYQKSNGGAIQRWDIKTEGSTIITTWGQLDGAQQETRDTIKKGKNLGRANATTPEQQAQAEALSRWEKKKKTGYVETVADAEDGKVDETVILGGVPPMLAPNKCYPLGDANLAKKIKYPAFVQPKLDGIRCIAVVVKGKCTLWSRTRKPILSVPHVVAEIEDYFAGQTVTLDGELYNHDMHDEFQEITSIVGQKGAVDEGRVMQYHMYDVVKGGPFADRIHFLQQILKADTAYLRVSPTYTVATLGEALALQDRFESEGYEGAMIRNYAGLYEQDKRSANLQKMKTWIDAEFTVVEAIEGRGKLVGAVGAFVVLIDTKPSDDPLFEGSTFGATFKATMKCKTSEKKRLWATPSAWKAKRLKVRFKRWTDDGVAYLPRGIAILDE